MQLGHKIQIKNQILLRNLYIDVLCFQHDFALSRKKNIS